MPAAPRHPFALGLGVAGLAGMAYCHVEDVGMKLDEHVYYMAALFCCNIAASILLIPLAVSESIAPTPRGRLVWVAAGALAALTIAGFIWSRTVGFPQMADHVGEWDTLGLTSLGFEAVVVAVSLFMLLQPRLTRITTPARAEVTS